MALDNARARARVSSKSKYFSALMMTALTITLVACSPKMSTADAGKKYLEAVCPANIANAETYEANVSGDFERYQANAKQAREAVQNGVKLFDESARSWPEEVQPTIEELKSEFLKVVAYYDTQLEANSFDEADAAPAPDLSQMGAIAQDIRAKLGLPEDTEESCEAFRD